MTDSGWAKFGWGKIILLTVDRRRHRLAYDMDTSSCPPAAAEDPDC